MSQRFAALLVCLLAVVHLKGQQTSFWSLNHLDPYIYNPAYAGFDKSLSANFHLLNQWNDISSGVQGQLVNMHLPLYIIGGGAGLQVSRDIAGPLQVIGGMASYNFVAPTTFGLISFSGRIGVQQWQLRGDELRTPDGVYAGGGNLDHRDDDLPINNVSGITPRADLGIYYQWDNLEIGLGWNNIFSPQVTFSNTDFGLQTANLFQFTSQYRLDWYEDFSLMPYVNVLSDWTQTQAQLGLHVSYNNNIYGGMAFRGYDSVSRDALIFSAGIRINNHFTLFYAYDYVVSRLKPATQNNTHEFTLNYNLHELIRTGLPPKVIYNPRF